MKLLVPISLYSLIVLFLFRNVLLAPEGKILWADDISQYHYFQKSFFVQSVKSGTPPLWDPYIFSGVPYAEHPQVALWYPINIIFLILPLAKAFAVHLVIHFVIAMTTMYALVGYFLRNIKQANNRELAAFLAGIIYGLATFFTARIWAGHVDIIASASWMPLVFLLFWKAMTESRAAGRAIVFAAGSLALQIFTGQQTFALFTIETVVIAAIILSVARKTLRPLVVTAGSIVIALLLSAVQVIPTYQYMSRSVRSILLPQSWSLVTVPTLWHLLQILDPRYFYDMIPKINLPHEHALYLGKASILLVFLAIAWSLKQKSRGRLITWIFAAIALFGLWVSFGANTRLDIFSILRTIIPFYQQLRIPSRHLVMYAFAIAGLTGIGAALIRGRVVLFLLTIFTTIELSYVASTNIHLNDSPEVKEDHELVEFFQKDQTLYRIFPHFYYGDRIREQFELNAPIKYSLFSASGYDAPPLRNYFEFMLAAGGSSLNESLTTTETTPLLKNLSSPYFNLTNSKYIFVPTNTELQMNLILDRSQRGYRLYENKNVLPRFFLVSQSQVLPSRDAVLTAIRENKYDPATTILLTQDLRLAPCQDQNQKEVTIMSYSLNRITLKTSADCDSVLVTSEVYYPGWRAYVDNKETAVVEGNAAFRTIIIPKGTHTVTMVYRPLLLYLSLLVSVITWGSCLLALKKLKS